MLHPFHLLEFVLCVCVCVCVSWQLAAVPLCLISVRREPEAASYKRVRQCKFGWSASRCMCCFGHVADRTSVAKSDSTATRWSSLYHSDSFSSYEGRHRAGVTDLD